MKKNSKSKQPNIHPVLKRITNRSTFGQRLADRVATQIGSWTFIVMQTIFILLWTLLNVYGYIHQWDAYPFVFLNLILAMQAAYAAPIILMSQNRETERDRLKMLDELATTRKAEREIKEMQRMLRAIEKKLNARLSEKNSSTERF